MDAAELKRFDEHVRSIADNGVMPCYDAEIFTLPGMVATLDEYLSTAKADIRQGVANALFFGYIVGRSFERSEQLERLVR